MQERAKEEKGKQPCQISSIVFKGPPYEMVVRAYFKWANQVYFSFLFSEVARLFFALFSKNIHLLSLLLWT